MTSLRSPDWSSALRPLVEALEVRAAGGPLRALPPAPAEPLLARLWAAVGATANLPISPPPARSTEEVTARVDPAPAPAAGPHRAGPLRVLAVDDNEVNRIVLAGLLGELGYRVQLAHDGEEAVRSYGEAPPDLVIMDLHMPRLDGLTAAARIRALERARGWARRPILALTADRSPGVPEACALAGMDGLHLKPVELEGLRARLDALRGGPGAPAPEAPPVLDLRQVSMMREVMGAEAYALLVRTFLGHTESELAALKAAVDAGDGPAVQRLAHSLKSSTAQMGATALSALARQIEGQARAGDEAALGSALDATGPALAALRSAIEGP